VAVVLLGVFKLEEKAQFGMYSRGFAIIDFPERKGEEGRAQILLSLRPVFSVQLQVVVGIYKVTSLVLRVGNTNFAIHQDFNIRYF